MLLLSRLSFIFKLSYMKLVYPKAGWLLLSLFLSQLLYAQTIVSGNAVSAGENRSLGHATIRIKGQNSQTTTDDKGAFTITVPRFPVILIISYTGFSDQDLK